MILDQLNVFILGILVLRRDTNVIHLLFVVVSLVLMSHLMSLNSDSSFLCLPRLLPVSLTESPSQKPLQVYRIRQKPPTKTFPRLVTCLMIPTLFQFLRTKLVPLILSLNFSFMVICLHLSMLLPRP